MSWLPLVAAFAVPLAEARVDCTCLVRAQKRTEVHITCSEAQNGSATASCVTGKRHSVSPASRFVGNDYLFLWPRSLVFLSRACQSWQQARSTCKSHGASLFVPLEEESVSLLSKRPFSELYFEEYFIGLNDERSEGIFVDMEGQPAHYLNWSTVEPNNAGSGEHCVTLYKDGKMNDQDCERVAPFLCERRLRSSPPTGYTWLAAAGSFVRASQDLQPHARAAAACAAEEAQLFVPDTSDRVEALLRHVPVDLGDMLVGLSDRHTEGLFLTDKGERLSDMEFNGWLPGQPDDGAGVAGPAGEDCVVLHSHGFLADVSCEQPQRYVCEWLP